jgi:hypothetical protein
MGFWEQLSPRDLIAGLLIVGGLVLLSTGIDGTVGAILVGIVAFYFGAEFVQKKSGEGISNAVENIIKNN